MSDVVHPAARYHDAPELAVVATYFNPVGWRSRRALFDRFAAPFADGGPSLFVIECAFGDAAFELPAAAVHTRVRARHALWQKERLLNAVVPRLPPRFTKIAWVDADVLFSSPRWAQDLAAVLDQVAVAQPFTRGLYLPPDVESFSGEGDAHRSFSAEFRRKPELHLYGDYLLHGVTGLCWGARRAVIERHGLYDASLSGSGDHLIAHGTLGDFRSPCVARTFAGNLAHAAHFARWVARWKEDVPGRIGTVAGDALHLFHGDRKLRRYPERNRELSALGFDPDRDLRLGEGGAWELADPGSPLAAWSSSLFRARREDGDEA